MTEAHALITVEVAYALPDQQVILGLRVPTGTTAVDAIKASGILNQFPEIDLERNQVGVFGKLVKADHALRQADRVEIYRPLTADPKERRRQRVAAEKKNRRGGA